MAWSPQQIPDQSGRTVVITGGNSGIGYFTAKHLASKGATVIMACRRLDAAEKAAQEINKDVAGKVIAKRLDLIDQDDVRRFVKEDAPKEIDILINNAGIMMTPLRHSPQGLESQWAINVVGHALLTKLLLGRIQDRVVTISSIAHRSGRIDPATFTGDSYDPWNHYAQSKLGDLMFALRLQKHLDDSGSKVKSIAAHPGVSLTKLAKDMNAFSLMKQVMFLPFLQSADKGSHPTLRAATDEVAGGSYWGPKYLKEWRGPPVEAKIKRRALDEAVQELLWQTVWEKA